MKEIFAEYVGPSEALRGETAIVMNHDSDPELVLALFDNLKLHTRFTHGWTPYLCRAWRALV